MHFWGWQGSKLVFSLFWEKFEAAYVSVSISSAKIAVVCFCPDEMHAVGFVFSCSQLSTIRQPKALMQHVKQSHKD